MVPVEELYNCTPSPWTLDYCITYNCFNFFYIEEVNNEGAIHAKQNVLKREHGCTAAFVSYSIDAFMIWHLEFIMCVCNIVQWKKIMICSDSLSCLLAIESCKTQNPFFLKMIEIYKSLVVIGKHIIFTWIPSYMGIHGNTVVDQEAGDVLDNPIFNCSIPYTNCKPFIIQYILKRWQDSWDQQIHSKLQRNAFLSRQNYLFLWSKSQGADLGQSIYSDNSLCIRNYYFLFHWRSFYWIEISAHPKSAIGSSRRTLRHVGLHWQLHDLRCVLKKRRNSKTSSGYYYHANDWWLSLTQIMAWHMTISTPMKKSNLELIWNN